ncbi:hypothetical protein CEXT_515241 [Caerostris extrusa]|uniref:Uncharacterized protein n=1 Tax=Caerostris extrusa TaxID=172846 RepID=A0AAV4NXH4_CAEEX|nr:hypothetical protein CEXT_515241 [Caerostris extrusa]
MLKVAFHRNTDSHLNRCAPFPEIFHLQSPLDSVHQNNPKLKTGSKANRFHSISRKEPHFPKRAQPQTKIGWGAIYQALQFPLRRSQFRILYARKWIRWRPIKPGREVVKRAGAFLSYR